MSTPTDRQTERVAVAVTVTGTVQGVGFRPFVARVAADHDLAGVVKNTAAGVETIFEGHTDDVADAVERVTADPPSLSVVDRVTVIETEPAGRSAFEIVTSADDEDRQTLVPPDTAVCADCLAEVRDPDSRFHDYWATACVDCGPRFAVTEGLPFDRDQTALDEFEPCEACTTDYQDRSDRRFHAQGIACPTCGPTVRFIDGDEAVAGPAAIERAATALDDGGTIGIKGAGGTHVACRATARSAVEELRSHLDRPTKPFATMCPSLDGVSAFTTPSREAAAALTDRRRPIVVLPASDPPWTDDVAPGLHTVGVMLPYSPLHHLLFDRLATADPLVMTSANRPGKPMATTTEQLRAVPGLDGVLTHDREIINRCDDSVVRIVNGDRRLLRRSRGWVPRPLPRPNQPDDGREVLAVGARTDVTAALTRDRQVVPSQHVGDVDNPETVAFHADVVDRLQEFLGVTPSVVAHDCHPELRTTALAREWGEDTQAVGVQHHHAHAASLLAEHDRDRAVVIVADGTGYGPEGVIRGGEVLDTTRTDRDRVGGIGRFRLPGGEAAVRRPARLLASLSDRSVAIETLLAHETVENREAAAAICDQADTGVNAPPTTSAGRFLDAVSALLGLCSRRRYQGEPARRLEAAAVDAAPCTIDIDSLLTTHGGERLVNPEAAFGCLARLTREHDTATVAATAQHLLGTALGRIAVRAAVSRDIPAVGFSGGVAYNPAIDTAIRAVVRDAGLTYLGHESVPPGDAGLSYGQAVVASARLAAPDNSL